MSARNAADTNVVLYLTGHTPHKAARVREILRPDTIISVQVLNEIANVFSRKWRRPWVEAVEFLELVRGFTKVQPLNEMTHDVGLDLAQRHQLSFYDSLIVASALLAKCDVLYSEDMHHGLVIGQQLTIINPFRPAHSSA